jgi:hypothetical protein
MRTTKEWRDNQRSQTIQREVKMGHWQEGLRAKLENGQIVRNPIAVLKGKAKKFASHYNASFQSLLSTMKKDGWKIKRVPGSRGGEWSATYSAYK